MATIKLNDFFKTPRTQSEIKSEILNEYFKAWAAILLIGQKRIRINTLLYIDLYAGPGYYDDDKPSTPIKVLSSINDNSIFNRKIKTFFNDAEAKVVAKLDKNIRSLPFYDQLEHKPIILNEGANKELLKELLSKEQKPPSLTFIDPLGYKGVSAELCKMAVANWGSDLFMLFNINRIRPGIKNTTVEHLMRELFEEKFDAILAKYDALNKKEREDFIVDQFMAHFRDRGYRAIKFKVEFQDKKASSHYLLFVSKVDIAYFRMKEIMAKYSDYQTDGVPWMAVNSSTVQDLFSDYSIVKLKQKLESCTAMYDGKTIDDIYRLHSIDTPYIKSNYKQAYVELSKSGKVLLLDKNGNIKTNSTYTSIIKYK